jgi:hypothetical protein
VLKFFTEYHFPNKVANRSSRLFNTCGVNYGLENVASHIVWFYAQPIGCKYKRNYLVSQYFSKEKCGEFELFQVTLLIYNALTAKLSELH